MDLIILKVLYLIGLLLELIRRRGDRWLHRQWLVRPMNQVRKQFGFFNTQWQELKEDPYLFHRYTAMNLETFNLLLHLVSAHLVKDHPAALCPEERLIISLRYLVSGDTLFTIALTHRIGESTAAAIVKEVCGVLGRVLQPIYLRKPTEEEWKRISVNFLEQWNMPSCVGAFDGKHFKIKAPPHSGSLYFNHKGGFSVILLAACDANYLFTLVHIGEMGSNNDAGVYNLTFGPLIESEQLDLPRGVTLLPGSNIATPCYFVGDDAFGVTPRMMKPFSGRGMDAAKRIFNYRLSRARRVIENAFGILVARFRIFESSIRMHPDSVDEIILAAVCLHNFLRFQELSENPPDSSYASPTFQENLHQHENYNVLSDDGFAMRIALKNYFLTPEGEVPWQNIANHIPEENWDEIDAMH